VLCHGSSGTAISTLSLHDALPISFRLFRDESAKAAFTYHWEIFAKRYKGIGKDQISFNLFNEAPWPYDNFNGEIYKNTVTPAVRSEEHTSELQSRENLVCRLLLEK